MFLKQHLLFEFLPFGCGSLGWWRSGGLGWLREEDGDGTDVVGRSADRGEGIGSDARERFVIIVLSGILVQLGDVETLGIGAAAVETPGFGAHEPQLGVQFDVAAAQASDSVGDLLSAPRQLAFCLSRARFWRL